MDALERRLHDAAETYFPATPDLARAARERLVSQRPERRAPRLALGVALVVLAVIAGVLALSPGARSALRDLLDRVPGISIERAATLPERGYRSTPYYGAPIDDVDHARRLYGRPLRLPADLGEPDRLYWLAFPPGDMITAVYGDERRARLVFSQWKVGTTDLWHKVLASGTDAALVTVDGAPGIWIFGADHGVYYLAPGESDRGPSTHHRAEAYLAGNVLAWQRNGIAYRLEAGVPLQEAMKIARSLEVAG
jgi:hypothetical protein